MMKEVIASGLEQMGLTQRCSPHAPELLEFFGQALIKKNEVMNLTSITDPLQVAQLHMLDCAALLFSADFSGKTLLDVGSGAGFPGVPLKILVPSLQVTLLDSLNKRVDWLNDACFALCLSGIQAIHCRAEEQAQLIEFREAFDFVTARAVADLRVLCELCLPFVKVGGAFLAMKSVDCDQELAAAARCIQLLGACVEECRDYTIPDTPVTHRTVQLRKVAPTPSAYPRRWSKIQKAPL